MTIYRDQVAQRETLRQYVDRTVREVAERCRVPMTEVRAQRSEQGWYLLWWDEIRRDAAEGHQIDRRALNALDPMHRRYLMHDYPNSIPDDYRPVTVSTVAIQS